MIESEQEYVEMMNELKKKYDLFEIEKRNFKYQVDESKKDIMVLYGLVKSINDFYSNYHLESQDDKLSFLIELTMTLLDGIIDSQII